MASVARTNQDYRTQETRSQNPRLVNVIAGGTLGEICSYLGRPDDSSQIALNQSLRGRAFPALYYNQRTAILDFIKTIIQRAENEDSIEPKKVTALTEDLIRLIKTIESRPITTLEQANKEVKEAELSLALIIKDLTEWDATLLLKEIAPAALQKQIRQLVRLEKAVDLFNRDPLNVRQANLWPLEELYLSFIEHGHIERAIEIVKQMLCTISTLPPEVEVATIFAISFRKKLLQASDNLIQQDKIKWAIELITPLMKEAERAPGKVMCEICETYRFAVLPSFQNLINQNKVEQAIKFLNAIPNSHRASALLEICQGLITQDQIQQIVTITRIIRHDPKWIHLKESYNEEDVSALWAEDGLLSICKDLLIKGKVEEASNLADALLPASFKERKLRTFCRILVRNNKLDLAMNIANQIEEEDIKARVLEVIDLTYKRHLCT